MVLADRVTMWGWARAAATLAVACALGSPATAGDPSETEAALDVRWAPGMRSQTTVWRMEFESTWLGDDPDALPPVQTGRLLQRCEEVECLEARDGRLDAARVTYGPAWGLGEATSSSISGGVFEYRADGEGRPQRRAGIPGSELPAGARGFAERAERLDPFRSRFADLARAAATSQGGAADLAGVAAVLGIGGYATETSRFEFSAALEEEPGARGFSGVLADVSEQTRTATEPAGWASGGDLHFTGGVWVGHATDATVLQGWIYGLVTGTVVRDSLLHTIVGQYYLDVAVQRLAPSPQARPLAGMPASPGEWPAWLTARGIGLVPVVSRVPDVPEEWRGFALRGARGELLLPAWLAAAGRTLDVLGPEGAPERPRRAWEPVLDASAFLLSVEAPSFSGAPGRPSPFARRRALLAGTPCWGLQPDAQGGVAVRAWTPTPTVRSEEDGRAAPLALGLTSTDVASGAWLVVDASGNVLGWTPPQSVVPLDALLDPRAPPNDPSASAPGMGATWTYAPWTLGRDMPRPLEALTEASVDDEMPGEEAWAFDVLQRARERLLQGRVAEAQAVMGELRRRHPTYAHLLEGALPMLERQVQRALRAGVSAEFVIGPQLDASLLRLPDVSEATRLAGLLQRVGLHDHAFAIAHACMGRSGSDEQALDVAARALSAAERWLDLALLLRQQPLNEGPTWVVLVLVDALERTGQSSEARDVLEGFPEARRSGVVYEQLVRARWAAREADLALDAARAWLARFPEEGRARVWVAHCLVKRGDFEAALREAERGLALASDDPALLELAARSAFGLQRTEQVQALIARLRAAHPERAAEVAKRLGVDPPADGK